MGEPSKPTATRIGKTGVDLTEPIDRVLERRLDLRGNGYVHLEGFNIPAKSC